MFAPKRAENSIVPTMVDLFAGAGGLSSGFARAGYKLIGTVENWSPAVQTLQANHPGVFVEDRDIRKVDADDFLGKLPSRPNLVLGGPSCQGFSTSGGFSKSFGRDISDERNVLFLDFIRFVHTLQPEWVVMENVPGLLLFKRGLVAAEVIKQFREIGYYVVPMILLAADFGVPQLRRRLFFVGNRTRSMVPFPLPTNGNPDLWKGFSLPFEHLSRIGNKSADSLVNPHVSFLEACGDLPVIEPGGNESIEIEYSTEPISGYQQVMRASGATKVSLHYSFLPSKFERAAIKEIKPGQNWTALPAELKTGRFSRIRPYDATTLLKRLTCDHPAYTINTKFNDATTGAYIHPLQDRTLSIREAARLQSFPDDYLFLGSLADIRKQIGNAVPSILAERIAGAMLPSLLRDMGFGAAGDCEDNVYFIDPDQDVPELIGLKIRQSKPQKQGMGISQLDLFAVT